MAHAHSSPEYVQMLKVAVKSARLVTSLVPVCMFLGDANSMLAKWLRVNGVIVIFHEPEWVHYIPLLRRLSLNHTGSHLNANVAMLVRAIFIVVVVCA